MGLSGSVYLLVEDSHTHWEFIWQSLQDCGFFNFFQPQYIEEYDFPLMPRRHRRKEVVHNSQVWLPQEHLIEGARATRSFQVPVSPDIFKHADAMAMSQSHPGWTLTLYGNMQTNYVRGNRDESDEMFRVLYDHDAIPAPSKDITRGGQRVAPNAAEPAKYFNWYELLKIIIHKHFSGSQRGISISMIIDSPAFLNLSGMPHPNLPFRLAESNWSNLIHALSPLATDGLFPCRIYAHLYDIRRVMPDGAEAETMERLKAIRA